jgi:argininosuccinate synthase
MSLYDQNLATYNIKTTFKQSYSEGFIELWGLPTKTFNVLKSKLQKEKEF